MRLACLAALITVISPAAAADDLLNALLAKTFDAPKSAFDVSFVHEGETFEARVDATKPEGERMVVTAPDRADWPEGFEKTLERMDRNAAGAIWCDEFLSAVPGDAERVADTPNGASYRFTPRPEEGAEGAERKLFEKLVATLVVDPETLTVRSYQLHLPAPTKPHIMAKIETFSMFTDCVPHESGNSHFRTFDLDISGSAMGRSFEQLERRRIANVVPAAFPDAETAQ